MLVVGANLGLADRRQADLPAVAVVLAVGVAASLGWAVALLARRSQRLALTPARVNPRSA